MRLVNSEQRLTDLRLDRPMTDLKFNSTVMEYDARCGLDLGRHAERAINGTRGAI
jgi:hypothetical protein